MVAVLCTPGSTVGTLTRSQAEVIVLTSACHDTCICSKCILWANQSELHKSYTMVAVLHGNCGITGTSCDRHVLFLYFVSQCIHALNHPYMG